MNAKYLIALLPAFLFVLYEFPDTVISNIVQIFNHAHAILCPVSFIKIFQSPAGILLTLI